MDTMICCGWPLIVTVTSLDVPLGPLTVTVYVPGSRTLNQFPPAFVENGCSCWVCGIVVTPIWAATGWPAPSTTFRVKRFFEARSSRYFQAFRCLSSVGPRREYGG